MTDRTVSSKDVADEAFKKWLRDSPLHLRGDFAAFHAGFKAGRAGNETPVSPALLGNDILTCLRKCQGEHPLLRQAADALEEMTTALRLIAGADGTECAVPRVVAGRALGLQQETPASRPILATELRCIHALLFTEPCPACESESVHGATREISFMPDGVITRTTAKAAAPLPACECLVRDKEPSAYHNATCPRYVADLL